MQESDNISCDGACEALTPCPSPNGRGEILAVSAMFCCSWPWRPRRAAWRHCRWNLFADDDLGCYASRKAQPICIEAVAVESPQGVASSIARSDARDADAAKARGSPSIWFRCATARRGSRFPAGRRCLVIGEPPNVEAGDRIRCFGQLSAPDGPQNPGAFDYAARLRADRVLSRLQAEVPQCVSVVETGSDWNLSRQLQRVRSHSNQLLERYLDPRRAELAAAVLLGLREELDADRREAFLTTGTVHILCISGLHVGILAGALFWIMRRTRSRAAGPWQLSPLSRSVYALMVDAAPSVVRATILVLVACIAVWLGRRPLGFNSLAAAALVVLAINPAHLFHVGAQLSFLCVAGLIWFATRRPHWDDESERNDKNAGTT